VRRRYPFEALRGVRQERVDQRAVELSGQARRREQATRERERAELALRAEERNLAEATRSERARLEQGVQRAAELQAELGFAQGAARRISERAAARQAAREREQREGAAESRARALLAQADAENRAVEKHHERWERARAVAVERDADEDALDHFSSRSRARRDSRGDG
jgi:hypothetical protein